MTATAPISGGDSTGVEILIGPILSLRFIAPLTGKVSVSRIDRSDPDVFELLA